MSNLKYVALFSRAWWNMEFVREQTVAANGDETGFPAGTGGSGGAGGIEEYDSAKSYSQGDLVIKDEDLFQANEDIPAGSAFLIGNSGRTWTEISSSVMLMADHEPTRGYEAGSIVYKDNTIYRAKVTTNPGPFLASQWEVLNTDQANRILAMPYDEGKNYVAGQLIYRDDKLMRCLSDTTGTFAPAAWKFIEAEYVLAVNDFANNGSYEVGELAIHESRLYRAKEAIANPGSFDPSKWELVGGGGGIPDFSPTAKYVLGDTIVNGDYIYRCTVQTFTGAFDKTKWAEIGGRSKFRGAFTQGTGFTYKQNDVVFHEGQLWMANNLITNPTAFNVGTSGATFRSLSREGAITPFSTDTYYVEGDHVIYKGIIYKAKTSGEIDQWDYSEWTFVADLFTTIKGYQTTIQYRVGNVIEKDGHVLRCTTDILTPKAYSADDWEDISGGMRGQWVSTTTYRKDDVVFNNNKLYRANGAIAKGTGFSVGTSNTSWTELAPPANPSAPDWADGTAYSRHDLVINEGSLFRCITAHTGDTTFDATKFQSLKAEGVAAVADFQVGTDYVKEQLIVSGGTLWRCRAQLDDAAAADGPAGANSATYWQAVSLTYLNLGDHSEQATYRKDELVVYNNKLYRANDNIDTAVSFSLNNWTAISEETYVISDFDSSRTYLTGEMIFRSGQIWVATEDLVAGTFDATKWASTVPRSSWRGAFSTAESYIIGDRVIVNNALFEATAAHSGTFDDDNFTRVNVGLSMTAWAASTWVNKGDMLHHGSKVYRATASHTTGGSFSETNLTLIGDFKSTIPDLVSTTEYVIDDVVYHNRGIYRCLAAVTGFDETKWKLIASHKHLVESHDQSMAYEKGEQVIYANKMYIAQQNVAVNTAFDPDDGNWLLVSSDAVATEVWAAEVEVSAGEVRIVKGVRMKSRTARTTGTTDNDAELAQWQLEEVSTANEATLNWDISMLLPATHSFDLEGKCYDAADQEIANKVFTVVKDLPSADIAVIKSLGYRFLLNGLDVTDHVTVKTNTTRLCFDKMFIDKGDVIKIVSPK